MGLLKEFKEFAMRGNVIDMAVGVVVGAAFTGIVNSLVKDIITPPLGAVMAGVDFSKLAIDIPVPAVNGEVKSVPVLYGLFLQSALNFIIIAFVLFLVVKGMNTLKQRFEAKEELKEAAPPIPTKDQQLLTEIRDLLKQQTENPA